MRTSPETLRIGMIGAGWVTQYHLPGWARQVHRARVVAIADPDLEAARLRSAEYGIAGVYASAEALLAAETLDVLDICAPREAHVALVHLATQRGLAVICQKPLAPSLAEARSLVAEIDPASRLMVHENWRFRPAYRRLKSWLDEGLAGEIRRVELHFLSSGTILDAKGQRPGLVRQPFLRKLPRMLVSEILIHHLDMLRFLVGELDLVGATMEHTNDEILGEDVATLTLRRRADGAPVEVVGSLAVHGAPPVPRDELRIFGERSTLTFDGQRLTAIGAENRSEDFDPVVNYQQSYDDTIGHFLDALAAGTEFETSPSDNLRTLALVEAAYTQARFRGVRESGVV